MEFNVGDVILVNPGTHVVVYGNDVNIGGKKGTIKKVCDQGFDVEFKENGSVYQFYVPKSCVKKVDPLKDAIDGINKMAASICMDAVIRKCFKDIDEIIKRMVLDHDRKIVDSAIRNTELPKIRVDLGVVIPKKDKFKIQDLDMIKLRDMLKMPEFEIDPVHGIVIKEDKKTKMSKERCVKLLERYRAEREKLRNGRRFELCLRQNVVDEALERAIELLKGGSND